LPPVPASSDDGALEAKLDLLIGLLRLAYREPLEQRRSEVLSDAASRAILQSAARDWVDAGTLKSTVTNGAKVSKPTVERRIAELVADGVLRREGAGAHVRYRSSGLIDP
jgi:Fic family protein